MFIVYFIIILLGLCTHDWVVFKVRTPKELIASLFCNTLLTAVIVGAIYCVSTLIYQNGWFFAIIPVVIAMLMLVGAVRITTSLLENLLRHIRGD